ncbi:MAG: prealbumin-like fold domain-containing protein [Clostridiales Family XIII bacterium]|nr:prealbumin-like fold domain-containing protein [Clostridiales Family XIII bacterium]
MPVLLFFVVLFSAFPIGLAFADDAPIPLPDTGDEHNITGTVVLGEVVFTAGFDPDEDPPFAGDVDGQNFGVRFDWQLATADDVIAKDDYFDIVLDLGLGDVPATVMQQLETYYGPILKNNNGQTIGHVVWTNKDTATANLYYSTNEAKDDGAKYATAVYKRVVLRFLFDGLAADGPLSGTEGNPVQGGGRWAFTYAAEGGGHAGESVVWSLNVDGGEPSGGTTVVPETKDPYEEELPGHDKLGVPVTGAAAPQDTLYFWWVAINQHKHTSYVDWTACADDADHALPQTETFTLRDTSTGATPTWLRALTPGENDGGVDIGHPESRNELGFEALPKPVVGNAITVDEAGGFYGRTVGAAATDQAWFKLYYVNTEVIWNDLIRENPIYKDPGAANPYASNTQAIEAWMNAMLYAPNAAAGAVPDGYLTPVSPEDVCAITVDETAGTFEITMNTDAVYGRTLAIGYFTKPVPDEEGKYVNNTHNRLDLVGADAGTDVTWEDTTARVATGGWANGTVNPYRGNFVIEKANAVSMAPLPGAVFTVAADVKDSDGAAYRALADKLNEALAGQTFTTGEDGRLLVTLSMYMEDQLPWSDGEGGVVDMRLVVTETSPPSGYAGLSESITVTLSGSTGKVKAVETADAADAGRVVWNANEYPVRVLNTAKPPGEGGDRWYDVALRKWVKRVERTDAGGTPRFTYEAPLGEGGEEIPSTGPVPVWDGDTVFFRIDIFNQSPNRTVIPTGGIVDYLPAGLRFDPGFAVSPSLVPEGRNWSNAGLWEWADEGQRRIRYCGPPIVLEASGQGGSSCYLPLIVKVDFGDSLPEGLMTNFAEVALMQDENGNPVPDVDSVPDDERDNDGTPKDNEVDEHRFPDADGDGAADATPTAGQDEDDHDYAQLTLIPCQVDKDTIRRTSAAFSDTEREDGFRNVGEESYRYDIDFRLIASVPADEFVVEDPLENVGGTNQVRLLKLATPVVWGDVDGLFDVLYKAGDDEWRTWRAGLSTTEQTLLEASELGLNEAKGEAVTALRFVYGAVEVGFTSKNYADTSLNLEHRDPLTGAIVADEWMSAADAAKVATVKNHNNAGLSPAAVDWTPVPTQPDYAAGAAEAQGLKPASYLVAAVRPFAGENIVSSAIARASTKITLDGQEVTLTDADQDAVITKEIAVEGVQAGGDGTTGPLSVISETNTPKVVPSTKKGAKAVSLTDEGTPLASGDGAAGGSGGATGSGSALGTGSAASGGKAARTGDAAHPLLWILVAIACVAGVWIALRTRRLRGTAHGRLRSSRSASRRRRLRRAAGV